MDFETGNALVNLSGWEQVLYQPQHSKLNEVYNFRDMFVLFEQNWGVFYFHRHAYVHYPDKLTNRCRLSKTDQKLLEAIPEFMPKLFFLVATTLLEEQKSFKKNLVEFLQLGMNAL